MMHPNASHGVNDIVLIVLQPLMVIGEHTFFHLSPFIPCRIYSITYIYWVCINE
jgi:hypothetical protein